LNFRRLFFLGKKHQYLAKISIEYKPTIYVEYILPKCAALRDRLGQRSLTNAPEQEPEDEEGRDGGNDVAHLDLRSVHHRNILTGVNLKVVLGAFLKRQRVADIFD
jgi:hypothetical protein